MHPPPVEKHGGEDRCCRSNHGDLFSQLGIVKEGGRNDAQGENNQLLVEGIVTLLPEEGGHADDHESHRQDGPEGRRVVVVEWDHPQIIA